MTSERRPTLERFMDALQVAADQGLDTQTVSPAGLRGVVDDLRRAAAVARTITLLDNPVAGPGSDLLDALVAQEGKRARRAIPEPSDPDDACARETAEADALYYAGLCVGLLVADLV